MGLPVGLVYDPAERVVLDPDAGVRDALNHLFTVFARTGSARAVVQDFARDGLLFPVRIRKGAHKGELTWTSLSHWQVLRTLHNPRYAAAFVYGRRREARTPDGKKTFLTVPREQWTALFTDAHPGYLTWEQFESNQQVLSANAAARGTERDRGPAREGPALLQGLAICGRCGRRMTVRYHLRRGVQIPDYQCMRACIDSGGPRCLAVPGGALDAAIAQLLLDTVTPLALDVALSVQAELETRAIEADTLRRRHIERARQHADLARRRYLAVDPGNRLVADSLEADWNNALRALREAQDDYDKATAQAAETLTEQNKARIRGLATDFPALWSDPATPPRERKRVTRLLIEDVTLTKTDQIHLHVRFRGGSTTSLNLPIPPTAWQARQTQPATVTLIDQLLDRHTDAGTAEQLNAAGHRSGEGLPFTAAIVVHVRRKHQLPSHAQRLRERGLLTLTAIAAQLHVHPQTIKDWHHAGLLIGHQANDKNEQLYQPPDPGDPRLIRHLGSRLNRRVHTQPAPGGAV